LSSPTPAYDVVVIGAGPNGLAAAITVARAGLSALVIEMRDSPGGGARSEQLTLPGFVHDSCSAVHPLGLGSPFFRSLDLGQYGLTWVHPPVPLAHVLDETTVVSLERSIAETADQLAGDANVYRRLFEPLAARFDTLMDMVLGPLRIPSAPLLLARFGVHGLRSLEGLVRHRFRGARAPALLAGLSAHAMLPLQSMATAAFALVLGAAGHAVGWPIARGGSGAITSALVACLAAHGGRLMLNRRIECLADLPSARAYVFDVAPRNLVQITKDLLPARYRRRLLRFRHGPGVFKMDWALRAAIPWRHAACTRACTVHLAGDASEIASAEAAVNAGRAAARPFVLVVQPSLFDASRAPAGAHTAWAYCHVPHASALDAAEAIEARIEQFAPGFKACILARATRNAVEMEAYNPNYVGGDINGGRADLGQLFTRPVARVDPYATPAPNIFLCSSSTPPGGGVHGMCGHWAARSVLSRAFGQTVEPA
jgi:phytoene dehydrogenase-like protein